MQRMVSDMALEQINGGDIVGFIDGTCATSGLAGVASYAMKLKYGAAGAVVGAFCVGWGIGRLFE